MLRPSAPEPAACPRPDTTRRTHVPPPHVLPSAPLLAKGKAGSTADCSGAGQARARGGDAAVSDAPAEGKAPRAGRRQGPRSRWPGSGAAPPLQTGPRCRRSRGRRRPPWPRRPSPPTTRRKAHVRATHWRPSRCPLLRLGRQSQHPAVVAVGRARRARRPGPGARRGCARRGRCRSRSSPTTWSPFSAGGPGARLQRGRRTGCPSRPGKVAGVEGACPRARSPGPSSRSAAPCPAFAVPVADRLAGIVLAVGDDRPAVVLAGLGMVDLVAAARAVLDVQSCAGRGIERRGPARCGGRRTRSPAARRPGRRRGCRGGSSRRR